MLYKNALRMCGCVQMTRPEGLYDSTHNGDQSGMRPRSSVDPVKPMQVCLLSGCTCMLAAGHV